MSGQFNFCPSCATPLQMLSKLEDGGEKLRLRCSGCDWSTAELEIVGHCLKCGFRFPAQQAAIEDLVGHHVARGDE